MRADWVVGRNPVLEALTAGLPLKQAYVARGVGHDDRFRDIPKFAAEHSFPLLQATRAELDRITGGLVHQGVALQPPVLDCTDIEDIFDAAFEVPSRDLVIAFDQVTGPRNLGAIIRSAAALGTQGVVVPARRSASMTAAAWKVSVGTATCTPVARVTNLNQMPHRASGTGFIIIGLADEGDTPLSGIPGLDGPAVVVVGSEDGGLTRPVWENCDALALIPITSAAESPNASVATFIALYEVG